MARGSRVTRLLLVAGLVLAVLGAASVAAQRPSTATFKSGVDLVSVTAVVRDHKGRVVRNLSRKDFEVWDAGERRPIAQFRSDETALSIALLFDVSGSMQVAFKIAAARHAAGHVLSWLQAGRDEAALFTFDTQLHEIQGFTTDAGELHRALDQTDPFGATSLHDAIAEAARRVVARGRHRRAVIVLTDGIDTSSRLSASEVSGIASSIDVPVYVMAVVSPLDHPGGEAAVAEALKSAVAGDLVNLARWTGGELFVASVPAHASVAARQILNELRHQYLIAFEPSGKPGWHPLEVRARDKDLAVRARSGYFAGQWRPSS